MQTTTTNIVYDTNYTTVIANGGFVNFTPDPTKQSAKKI
jgi:hypothetical protein